MRKTAIFSAGLMLAATALRAQVGAPEAGFVRAADGSVRALIGIAGNLIAGPAIASEAISMGSSSALVFVKQQNTIALLRADGEQLASAGAANGPALLAFSSDGARAAAYVLSNGTLFQWDGLGLRSRPVDTRLLGGTPVALAVQNELVTFAVVERHRISLVTVTGENGIRERMPLPGIRAPLAITPDGAVVWFAQDGTLGIRSAGGDRHIALPFAVDGFEQLSPGWIGIREASGTRRFALRVSDGSLMQVPEARQ